MSLRTPRYVLLPVLFAILLTLSTAATQYRQAQADPERTDASSSALVPANTGFVGSQPSRAALTDIPADYLALYRTAAPVCSGLDWSILAGIGKIETDHGRSTAPGATSGENFAGAGGPMQFLQPTFDSVVSRHTIPSGGATPPSRYSPHDAIFAAADYLCDSGAGQGNVSGAILTYNHSEQYLNDVLARAAAYAGTSGGTNSAANANTGDSTSAATGTTSTTGTDTAAGTAGTTGTASSGD
ncbi:MAG: transglycosylase SLT domain-containing protein [Pseudonocardiaceae bacterium]